MTSTATGSAGLVAVVNALLPVGTHVLTVGVGKQYATVAAAINASRDGDVIRVDAGAYTNDFATITHKITIEGMGGMVRMVATIPPPNNKGIFVVDNDVTIKNLSFSGAAISAANGGNAAGIRYEGGQMVLINDAFIGNQNGVMGNPVIAGLTNSVTIDHSLFSGNGSGTGYTHNLYIGAVSKLTAINSIFEKAVVGHEFKSRALVNDIENNIFRDGPTGTASYSIDLPNGGVDLVQNNLIEKGPLSQQVNMIHFGGEGTPYAGSSLTVAGNSFVNDRTSGTVAVFNQTSIPVAISSNQFTAITAAHIASGPAIEQNNTTGTGALLPNATILSATTTVLPPNGSGPDTSAYGLTTVVNTALPAGTHVLTVGIGKTYATVAAAVNASHDGDVIRVDTGTYTNDFATITHKITIEGMGGMVKMVATIPPPNSKGIFVVDNDVTIKNLSFSGAAISAANGGNGAGIRYEGGQMVLINDAFIGNQNGVMGNPVITGLTNTVTIDHSLFSANGSGSGNTHNLYIGAVASLKATNSIFEKAVVGHDLKSRALVNDLENNVFRDGSTGTASYDIDLPNGGVDLIKNNIIEKGPNAQQGNMIHFGGEGTPYAGSSLTVTGNSFFNDRTSATVGVFNQTTISATVTGNQFTQISAANIATGPAAETGNTLIFTDTLTHAVTLNGAVQAVQGGAGHLTVTAAASHVTATGGAGGMDYTETGSATANQITTRAGSVNTLHIQGSDQVDSEGTDTLYGGNATVGVVQITAGAGVLNFIGGSGAAVIVGVGSQLHLTGGSGSLTASGGIGATSFTAGSGTTDLTLNPAGGVVTFGPGSTTVHEASLGVGVLFDFVAGKGGAADVVNGFRVGIDKLALVGGVAVQSQSVSGGSANLLLTDGTRLQLAGVTDTTHLFG